MNRFEQILYDYGMCILGKVFAIALKNERYEDCAVMRDIAKERGFDLDADMEKWQAEFWRLGYSGETAVKNIDYYLLDALRMAGYDPTEVLVKVLIKRNII